MKYFSEKTGKLYDKKEQLEQAEQEFDAKDKEKAAEKAAEEAAEKQILKELKGAFDKATEAYRKAMAKVEEAKFAAALCEKRLKEADDACQEQKAKIKAREAGTPKRKCCVVKDEFELDPVVSAFLKYFGY